MKDSKLELPEEPSGVENKEDEMGALKKALFVPDDKEFHQVKLEEGGVTFNFLYSSLSEEVQKDLERVESGDTSEPNAIAYAMKVFSAGFNQMKSAFPRSEELDNFFAGYPITIFLARDFDELCTVGSPEKRDLPAWVTGRTFGETLIYTQSSFVHHSRNGLTELSEREVLGKAHELLHIYYKHNRSAKYENINWGLPFLFAEGLMVVCAKQVSKDFAEPFVSPEQLFLENGTQAFKHDQRQIAENAYYQSAGHFMNYLLTAISEKEGVSYQVAFQKVFDTIGCPEGLDAGNFSAEKYMKNVFGLDIVEEYNKFLAKARS